VNNADKEAGCSVVFLEELILSEEKTTDEEKTKILEGDFLT